VIITFHNDVPFPEHNWVAYQRIYVAEQWLRRIACTALYGLHGRNILGALPEEQLRQDLKRRQKMFPDRAYLGSDEADEAIWLTTLDELRALLTDDSILPMVKKLTGLNKTLLSSKLDEIREVRNIVGHNRPVSIRTLQILDADLVALSQGIERFKEKIFGFQATLFDCDLQGRSQKPARSESTLAVTFAHLLAETPSRWHPSALRLAESEHFYFAVVLPEEFRDAVVTEDEKWIGRWIDLQVLLNRFADALPMVLAFLVTRGGDSYGVTWPKKARESEQMAVIETFLSSADEIWDGEEYVLQDERLICHPKVWFHSNW
jgi:hypothetical protein